MKYLKYFLVIGFFLQGCDVENPLLRSEDALKGDEAVIVFNLYVKYPEIHNFFESIAGLEPNAYMNLELRDNTNANYYIIRTDNYMSSSNVSQKYVVATVSKGTYFLSACSFYFSWVTGAHDGLNIITIKSPVYNSQTYPLTFTVEPGEVKYLGNIEIIRPQNPNAVFIPVFQIHNQLSEAKKFMQERYPNLSSKLVEGLIKKTAKQLLVEESQE